jgi:F-type H+-transporting ATPase subunit delta
MRLGERVVAERYARALLEVLLEKNGDPETVESELAGFQSLLEREQALASVLSSPTVTADKRVRVLDGILRYSEFSSYTKNVLRLLTAKERMGVLPLLLEQFKKLLLDHQKIQPGEVVSAHPLTQTQQLKLAESLGKAIGKTMKLTYETNPSIVGGLVVRLGNRVYDASVVTQLRRFKEKALSSF